MIRNFDIDALRTMVVGVELGSFTRAASELGRSQSAISMHIKKLEDRAGKPLFVRRGRGLVPTEAGEQLLSYARKIIALNDEAAIALGVGEAESTVKLGLPQDFFDALLPKAISAFSCDARNVHVDVRAGRNYGLEDEVYAGRLDAALAFFPVGAKGHGELLATLPTGWFAGRGMADLSSATEKLPVVLHDHPCLFRTNALSALEGEGRVWRVVLTTPSLAGVWAAVGAKQGVTSRTLYRVPAGVEPAPERYGLPKTSPVEVRLLMGEHASPASHALGEVLRKVVLSELARLNAGDRAA